MKPSGASHVLHVRSGQIWRSKRNGQCITIKQRTGDSKRWQFTTPNGQVHTTNENRLAKWYELVSV